MLFPTSDGTEKGSSDDLMKCAQKSTDRSSLHNVLQDFKEKTVMIQEGLISKNSLINRVSNLGHFEQCVTFVEDGKWSFIDTKE